MMLRASQISFAYGRTRVLERVSVELEPGGMLGVIGPNGAGKSTLLRCLYGALRPASGHVWLGQRELGSIDRREIARWIGVVPQQCHPVFPVSVQHFVGLGRFAREKLLRGPTKSDREVVRRSLEQMGLGELASRSVDELSGGEFRRVLIAQALAQEPRILLFDEPIQQLDLRHQLEVMAFARDFARREGCATLVVLHDLGFAARFCDTLALLHQGRIVSAGAPESVLTRAALEQVFGVHAQVERHPATGAIQVLPLEPCASARTPSAPPVREPTP